MQKKRLCAHLGSLADAVRNCVQSGNAEWQANHANKIVALVREHMPSGSGIDAGVTMQTNLCSSRVLCFASSYHTMDEHGSYSGWVDFLVRVDPTFDGIEVEINSAGNGDVEDHKDYLSEVFYTALMQEVEA
jgi:hypothetical protein